jgi:vacuolar protein sorting-associated protein 11
MTLDLPTVHFLCKHSFHQRCLNPPSTSDANLDPSRTGSTISASNFISDSNSINNAIGESIPGGVDEGRVVECPICAPTNAMVRDMKNARVQSALMNDLFQDELKGSRERFATVAEWFGRGVMGGQNVGE